MVIIQIITNKSQLFNKWKRFFLQGLQSLERGEVERYSTDIEGNPRYTAGKINVGCYQAQ